MPAADIMFCSWDGADIRSLGPALVTGGPVAEMDDYVEFRKDGILSIQALGGP